MITLAKELKLPRLTKKQLQTKTEMFLPIEKLTLPELQVCLYRAMQRLAHMDIHVMIIARAVEQISI